MEDSWHWNGFFLPTLEFLGSFPRSGLRPALSVKRDSMSENPPLLGIGGLVVVSNSTFGTYEFIASLVRHKVKGRVEATRAWIWNEDCLLD